MIHPWEILFGNFEPFNKYIIFIFLIIIQTTQFYLFSQQTHLVLTAALVPNEYEFRKQQYIKNLKLLSEYGYKNPYIIEAVKKKGPTFLDNLSSNVFYAQSNDYSIKYQGANECKTLLEGLIHFKFNPDDMIIKLTGRYYVQSDSFLKLVENNIEYDAIVKNFTYGKGVFSSCFALKCKYLIEMLENINYNLMATAYITFESALEEYLIKKEKSSGIKILYINNLGIKAIMRGSTTAGSHILNKVWIY